MCLSEKDRRAQPNFSISDLYHITHIVCNYYSNTWIFNYLKIFDLKIEIFFKFDY